MAIPQMWKEHFFLILMAGSAFMPSSKLKFFFLLSYALSPYTLSIHTISAADEGISWPLYKWLILLVFMHQYCKIQYQI
jgi:hypothetical protein